MTQSFKYFLLDFYCMQDVIFLRWVIHSLVIRILKLRHREHGSGDHLSFLYSLLA